MSKLAGKFLCVFLIRQLQKIAFQSGSIKIAKGGAKGVRKGCERIAKGLRKGCERCERFAKGVAKGAKAGAKGTFRIFF